jgi:hypothetical protein
MKSSPFLRRSLCFLLISLFFNCSYAASPLYYQVEIIGFTIADNGSIASNEQFPAYPALPEYNNVVDLKPYEEDALDPTYMLLPKASLKLNRESNLIGKKERYDILFHMGWLQKPGEEQKVRIFGASSDEQYPIELNGTIKIKKGYYYVVDFNFDLYPLTQSRGKLNSHYVLATQRKLKSLELNYIDHPKFGILMEIFPIEK